MAQFSYLQIEPLSINGMRVYEVPGGKFYPSITTVLGHTMPKEKSDKINKWILSLGKSANSKRKQITDKGTSVHLMAERFLKKMPVKTNTDNFDNDAINSFNGLKLKLKKISNIWAQEEVLFSHNLCIAGRCDCIGEYDGKVCIIDFKTSNKIKTAADIIDYSIQLTAYAEMHNEMFNTNISTGKILMSSNNGIPQEFTVDLSKYVIPLKNKVTQFYSSLKV